MNSLIYFDNAATSWPKPKSVIKAISASFGESGGNPGRSYHPLSLGAAKAVYSCREALCSLFGCVNPENVVFAYNTTHALNMAIKGLAQKNSHMLISNLEHNSVIRPVHALCADASNNMSYDVFDARGTKEEILKSFEQKIRPETKLAAVTMASNVCGKILPVGKISEICRKHGIKLIADCAQSAGCVPFDFASLGADVLCGAGHKSLYGPQGVGFCIFADGLEPRAVIEGGNGVNSASPEMDGPLPERLEAGTMGTPAICGLEAGVKYVADRGVSEIYERGQYLADYLCDGLKQIDGIEIYGECDNRTPCVLFNKSGVKSEKVAAFLADEGICVRSGLHCAPLAHKAFGTEQSGAVRVSMSVSNKPWEIDKFLLRINSM